MPFSECNENICVAVLRDVRQNQASVHCEVARTYSSDLKVKGINCDHLHIQGICGQNMSKFSELKLMLTDEEIRNLHVFGLSETKLKGYKITNAFLIDGFQKPYRKDSDSNGGAGLLVYVRNGINAKRRRDLETQDIACLRIEVTPENGKSFLVENLYRPPDSKIEYTDRF